MQYEERSYHVNRILFCRTIFSHKGKSLYVHIPSPIARMKAEILYRDSLESGAWTEDDRLEYLRRIWHWGSQDEINLDNLRKEIDNLKISLYDTGYKKAEGERIRKVIVAKYEELKEAVHKRSLFDDTTQESLANQIRFKYIVASSIKKEDGSYYFNVDPLLVRNTSVIDRAITSLLKDSLNESNIRDIARSEPWSSIWSSSEKCSSLFGVSAADLTDEQKILIYWSQLYENIRSNADLPEDVVGDDWKLDGWLIKKRREREQDKIKESVAKKISPKVAQGDMIFIPAENQEEMEAIDSLNDAGTRMIKKRFQSEIQQRGNVKIQDTFIGQQEKLNQINRMKKS